MILTMTGSGRRLSWLSSVIAIHWPLVSPYGGVSLVQEITCFMTALVKSVGIQLKSFSLEMHKILIITICCKTAPAVSMQLSNLLLGNSSWGSLRHSRTTYHDDVIKWKHSPLYWPFVRCGEFTGPRWIPHTKASDAELWCFLWSAPV